MRKIFEILSISALMTFSFNALAGDPYKVKIPTASEDLMGAMIYLVNYDTGENVDSALVTTTETVFEGQVDEPFWARIVVDGNRMGSFIVENGIIVWSPERKEAFGSPYNDKMNEFSREVENLSERLSNNPSHEAQELIFGEYETLINRTLDENSDNPIGYFIFIQEAANLSEKDFNDYLEKYPDLAKYQRVAKIQGLMKARAMTQPGHKYLDFSIPQPDGKVLSLSDFVKPGKFTLVDFWASWCGPCIKEISVLKNLWNKYHDKELDIVGVAVWDEPQNTEAAIRRLELPWPCIINAQSIPTDLYGISGIPCIILIGPDGTILSRDKQDEELTMDVINALNKN